MTTQQTDSYNPFSADMLERASEEAIAASTTSTFGRLSVALRFMEFHGKGETPTDLTQQEYEDAHQADPRSVGQEVEFKVDPSDINPDATFVYKRKVSVQGKVRIESNDDKTGKVIRRRVDSDWLGTVLPSINEAFGSIQKMGQALAKGPVYVEVTDVPQVKEPEFGVTKIVRVFADKDECAMAWKAKYGGKKIPANIVENAKVLRGAVGSQEEFVAMVAEDPALKAYSPDKLWAATEA